VSSPRSSATRSRDASPRVSFPERIAIASRNAGKLREIEQICGDWPVSWITVRDRPDGWPDVEETGTTYLENALLKARAVAAFTEEAAIADDSGIEVDALGGGPGPRSARYAGEDASDERNLSGLLFALKGVPTSGRAARYRCVAAIVLPDGSERWTEGVCDGTLTAKRKGSGGFGYDPIFVPAGWDLTMAELPAAEKDRISHRGRAFRAMRALLAEG
jgi:XTP/dITP diphosphohydrolase